VSHTFHSRSHRLKRKPLCAHHTPSTAKNDAWHAERKAMAARGETMRQCPTCLRYLWPDEMGTPHADKLVVDFGSFSSLWSVRDVLLWLQWAARQADREASREERRTSQKLPPEQIRELRVAAGRFYDLCEAIERATHG
jgi:hypothetical protein